MQKSGKFTTAEITLIPLFSAIIAVCAQILIPFGGVPFTLQLFAVYAAVFILGERRALLSVAVYIALGAVGVPVFAGFKGGVSVLLNVTGGYTVGFLFIPLVFAAAKRIFKNKSGFVFDFAVSIISLCVCYTFGTVWFVALYAKNGSTIGFFAALLTCVVPYVLPDVLKILLAQRLGSKVKQHIKLPN